MPYEPLPFITALDAYLVLIFVRKWFYRNCFEKGISESKAFGCPECIGISEFNFTNEKKENILFGDISFSNLPLNAINKFGGGISWLNVLDITKIFQ